MKWVAAFLLFATGARPAADDKAAQELLQAVRDRIDQAQSLRVEGRTTVAQGEETLSDYAISIRIRGRDRWVFEAKSLLSGAGREDFIPSVYSDGKKVLVTGTDVPGSIKLAEGGRILRSLLATLAATEFESHLTFEEGDVVRSGIPLPAEVKDAGTGRLGDVEARIVEYAIRSESEVERVRLFVDPATKRPLRKEFVSSADGSKTTETYTTFSFNLDLPDSEFSFQTTRRLARVRAEQLARSVELYAAATGRYPRSLGDLVRRPDPLEPEVFWPEGGFVLGGVVPKDPWGRAYQLRVQENRAWIFGLGSDGKPGGTGDAEDVEVAVAPASRSPLGAPSERLQKYFTARVQVHLLAAALRAYRDATGELPRKKAALWEKPEDSPAWPEGGWIGATRVPSDPWGDPYRIISDRDRVRVQVRDPKTRGLAEKQLSTDEIRKLNEIARPRLSDDERRAIQSLLDRLSEDDLEAREKAEADLRSWGPSILGILHDRMTSEKDDEARLRVQGIIKAIPPRRPAWMRELLGLKATVLANEQAQSEAALLSACESNLAQLWKLEQVYMNQFGKRRMPDATGKEFWLVLSQMQPPIVDPTSGEVFVCPASGIESKPGVCTYRGPAEDVARMGDRDPVGMCDDDSHGDSVVILRKSGEISSVPRGSPEHDEALRKTKP